RAAFQLCRRGSLLPADARARGDVPGRLCRLLSQLRDQGARDPVCGPRPETSRAGNRADQEEGPRMKAQVICVPGSVAPAAQRYGPLSAAGGQSAALHLKGLELYREDAPPAGYSIDLELDGIDRFAGGLGLRR